MTRAEYIELSRERKRLEELSIGPVTFGQAIDDIQQDLNGCYNDAMLATQRRLQPRVKSGKYKDLPIQFEIEVVPHLHRWGVEDLREKRTRRKELDEMLIHAEVTDLRPFGGTWHCVKRASTSDYGSQGYGADTYARGSLKWAEDALTRAGVPFHVNGWQTYPGGSSWGGGYYPPGHEYCLWAPIEPELLTYVIVNYGQDPLEVNRKHGLNNAVLHPFDQRTPF